jgi:hypothetical protein
MPEGEACSGVERQREEPRRRRVGGGQLVRKGGD